eukprot:TRINITY_DN12541_c0_g1_i2.p1 TRINITY_DN12541_c0_g1~~TRINITY_DN12541_c0_g1_i2.p1  ORF type:complete len:206 (+),score=21.13 TRINITY_DN12541_c0_g1_i2:42-659(+)
MALAAILVFLIDVGAVRFEGGGYSSGGGTTWHAQIVSDDFCGAGSQKQKACHEGKLKQMRSPPHVKVEELKEMLNASKDALLVNGPLNGWPALTDLRVESMTCLKGSKAHYLWKRHTYMEDPQQEKAKFIEILDNMNKNVECSKPLSVRARLLAKDWTHFGWSEKSPGFVFAYRPASLIKTGDEDCETQGLRPKRPYMIQDVSSL